MRFLAQLQMEEEDRQRRAKHYCRPVMMSDDPWPTIELLYNKSDIRELKRREWH